MYFSLKKDMQPWPPFPAAMVKVQASVKGVSL
jgi:hypothetical protein